MMSIEHILCPAKLPLEFDEGMRYAASLARVYNAELLFCHCAGAPELITSVTYGAVHSRIKEALKESLSQHIGAAHASNLDWQVTVVESDRDVGEAIVRTARERRVDLIVMRSRRSRDTSLLGSTAEQVSRTASCPVLISHPRKRTEGTNGRPTLRRVLVPHDFSSSSELALSYGLSIARNFRAQLHLLHVLGGPDEANSESASVESDRENAYYRAAQRLLNSVPEAMRFGVTHAMRWGKPYREALEYASEQNVDLLCMGALGRDFGSQALFGSNVDRVLRQAPCPVLVARPLKSASEPLILAVKAGADANIVNSRASMKGADNARGH